MLQPVRRALAGDINETQCQSLQSMRKRKSNFRNFSSSEPKRIQSLEIVGPHQVPFANRIFPSSSMSSPSSAMDMDYESPSSFKAHKTRPVRIRNPLLRSYYCPSPVLKGVHFQERLKEGCKCM